MIWLASVVGIFLFYKFVERKHKILTFKILGALAVLVGIGAAGIAGFEKWEEHRRTSGIKVEFSHKDVVADKIRIGRMVDKAFSELASSVQTSFPDIPQSDYVKVKQRLYSRYLDTQTDPDYNVILPKAEMIAFLKWLDDKTPENSKILRGAEENRLSRWMAELENLRKKTDSSTKRLLYASFLDRAQDSFSFEENKKAFNSKLTDEELKSIGLINELVESAHTGLYELFNAQADLQTKLSFKICNERSDPLEWYTFEVRGFQKGRSTSQSIQKSVTYSSYTDFNSDIIVPPKSCSSIEWTGDYKFLDRYEITDVRGRWKN